MVEDYLQHTHTQQQRNSASKIWKGLSYSVRNKNVTQYENGLVSN